MVFGRCRFIKDWPEWETSVHEDESQFRRQGRAMTYPFEFKVKKTYKVAVFTSEDLLRLYQTTLSDCTCGDFQERKLPCKHIYRLAVELGLIEIIKRSRTDTNGYNKEVIMEIVNSDDWDNHPEQIKRQTSAMDKKCTPTSINFENKTGIFTGSGKKPYETSAITCTCRDFFVRRLPCKHIYRLRYELTNNESS